MGNLEIWVHKNPDSTYYWQLYKNGKPIARSFKNYKRNFDAQKGADRFLTAIGWLILGQWGHGKRGIRL